MDNKKIDESLVNINEAFKSLNRETSKLVEENRELKLMIIQLYVVASEQGIKKETKEKVLDEAKILLDSFN